MGSDHRKAAIIKKLERFKHQKTFIW